VLNRRAFIAAPAALTLLGCREGRRKRIAVIPKAVSHLFWVAVEKGAQQAGQEFNVEILWNGPAAETDYSRQIQIVDSMIAQRVDGIAIAAAERKALVGVVDRAMAAGIPVTVFDSGLESTNFVTYVATDNLEAGRMAARKMAELIRGKGKVGMVFHAPGSASTMDREQGFTETMKREFPAVHPVGGQFGMSDRARARAVAENLLTSHPDLAGLFASAEPSSVGAALAVKAREAQDRVALVTFDSSDSMIEDLRAGVIDAMVLQDPQRMGYEAVRTLVQKLRGEVPPKRLDLTATVVQKQDLEEPNVRRLLSL
jgi:ribose transport system substrate-binding protein